MKLYNTSYADLSDKEIVSQILSGNEEAMLYLLYDRYAKDLRFYAYRYYDSLEYLEELTDELYIQLKGKNSDWSPLKNFGWRCSFRTWLCSVTSHLFLQKRDVLIALNGQTTSINENDGKEEQITEHTGSEKNQNLVILLEAINRLKNDIYKLILIKELEGYNHKEIAQIIIEKRKTEGIETSYKGNIVIPNAHYVDMNKARALTEVKKLIEQIKKEWYGNK